MHLAALHPLEGKAGREDIRFTVDRAEGKSKRPPVQEGLAMLAIRAERSGNGVVEGPVKRLAKEQAKLFGAAGDTERGKGLVNDARIALVRMHLQRCVPRGDRQFVAAAYV